VGSQTRVHGCLIHLDIIDGKIWVQRDETEDGVTYELVDAGIPKDQIVLGFHPADVRPHTGYAIA
jgi:XisI protein